MLFQFGFRQQASQLCQTYCSPLSQERIQLRQKEIREILCPQPCLSRAKILRWDQLSAFVPTSYAPPVCGRVFRGEEKV